MKRLFYIFSMFMLLANISWAKDLLKVYPTTPSSYAVISPNPTVWRAEFSITRQNGWGKNKVRIDTEIAQGDRIYYSSSQVIPKDVSDGVVTLSSVPLLPEGAYIWKFRLVRLAGDEIGSYSYPLFITNTAPRSYIEADGTIFVDGKPFFPIGTYLAEFDYENNFRIMKEAGINTAISYRWGFWGEHPGLGSNVHPELVDFLNIANTVGIKILFNISYADPLSKIYYCQVWPSGCLSTYDDYFMMGKYVNAVKGFPAVIGWYVNDERTDYANLRKFYLELKKYDLLPTYSVVMPVPFQHPFEVASRFLSGLYDTTDVLGLDDYPIGFNEDYRGASMDEVSFAAKTIKAAARTKPMWMVNQLDGGANYYGKGRNPTGQEVKNMAFQSLIQRANAIFFYSYFDLWRNSPVTPDPRYRAVFEERWAEIRPTIKEISSLTDVLLGGTDLRLSNSIEDNIQIRALEYQNKLYVLYANISPDFAATRLVKIPKLWAKIEKKPATAKVKLGRKLWQIGRRLNLTIQSKDAGVIVLNK